MSSAAAPSPFRVVLFAVASVATVALVVLLAKPLLVLFGGLLFGLALYGGANALARTSKLPYAVVLAAIVLAVVAAAVLAALVLGPRLRDQVSDLATRLPAAARDLLERVRHEPLGRALTQPSSGSATPGAGAIASGAVVALGTTVEILGGLVLVFFVGVYGAARPSDYADAVVAVTPAAHKVRVRAILSEVAHDLTRWLLGRLVAMAFVGGACVTAFMVLHVPLAVTLGTLAGLLAFVEYIGAVVSAVPPVLLAFTASPTTALWVLLVYTVVHVVEGYVITPLVARQVVRLPPALTLAGQVVAGALVGPLGLTFSTPLVVVAVVAVRTWRRAPVAAPLDVITNDEEISRVARSVSVALP
jgi:predicted PurR-regulated permease PerM